MSKIKFIHTADLHLDTPFRGLSNVNEKLADKLKDATFVSFKNIVDIAIEKHVDFLVISGDIFDSENKSLSAQLKFNKQLERLSGADIPVYFICGNHDPLNSWLDSLDFPGNVYRFGADEVSRVKYRQGEKKVDIYGISFAQESIEENLAKKFSVYSDSSAKLNLALLHGTLGHSESHESYAPFSLDDMVNKSFDYWALGHIHTPQLIRKSKPTVVYPGNPQGRDFSETGRRGCVLVEMQPNASPDIEFISTQEIRFETIEVNLEQIEHINEITKQISNNLEQEDNFDPELSYILRVKLTGKTHLHEELNKAGKIDELIEFFNENQLNHSNFRWIDQIKLNTRPDLELEQLKQQNDFSAEVIKRIEIIGDDNSKLEQLLTNIQENFSTKVKHELDDLTLEKKKKILASAKWKLLDQLLT